MSASNLHIYVMAAPLLTAMFVNLFGRKSKAVVSALVLGSLGFSSILVRGYGGGDGAWADQLCRW